MTVVKVAKPQTLITIISMAFVWACNSGKPVDQSTIKAEKEARELKRISNADLMIAGDQLGQQVLREIEVSHRKAISGSQSLLMAGKACSLAENAVKKNLEDSLEIFIFKKSYEDLNEIEQDLWEAYDYAPEANDSQIQVLDPKTLLVTKPIRLSDASCFSCHGGDVGDQKLDSLKSLFGNRVPIKKSKGDLIGLWSISIPKKTVVSRL